MEFFSLRNNDKKISTHNKDLLNIKELISKLDILFEEQLSKTFKDILIIPRNNFLNIIISEVKNFLDDQYGEEIYKNEKFINFFSSSCNNLEDKYNTFYEELTKAWEDFQSNKHLNNEKSYFFSNFRKHCIDTDNFAMHNCSEGKNGYFIQVVKKSKKNTINTKKKNIQNSQVQYLICNKCKAVYFSNKFINFCKECNINYLCSILSYNEDPDLLLATLDRPHCETLVNEKIKCFKCKDNCLYLNMKLNRLQCHNKSCTYNEVPYNIQWTCNICNNNFYSNVKIYNPVEIQQVKDIIKLTLLLKKRAHPTKVTCCKNINVLTEDFFHKKECNGLLYFGEYNSKTIIVCDKCKAINFLVKFIWTCPLCGTRFKDKGVITNEEKSRKFLSPTTHENKKNKSYKKNILYENENNSNNYKKYNNENRSNNSSCRKNKETLSSLLKKRSVKNFIELNNKDNNLENNPYLNNSISIPNFSKKEILNQNEKLNIIHIKENIKKNSTRNINNNTIEKSFTESRKINKTYKKKNSILDKQCGNIEPIKEETETKLNSPAIPKTNNEEIIMDKFSIQEPLTTKNGRIKHLTRNKKFDKENCLSPKMSNNSIFNNYIKYVNISSSNKDNLGNKIFVSYSKRQNEEDDNKFKIENENKNDREKENNKNGDNNNTNSNINAKRSYVGSCRHRTRKLINIDNENVSNINNNKKDYENKKDKEEYQDNHKNEELYNNSNYNYLANIKTDEITNHNIRNSNTNISCFYKTNNKNEFTPTPIYSSKYLFYKNKKSFQSQDNISDNNSIHEEENKNANKNNNSNNISNNIENKENNYINDKSNISRCETLKYTYNNKNNDALYNILQIKKNLKNHENFEIKKENDENGKNDAVVSIRYRSKFKNKTKDKERRKELSEINKSEEENNSKIINQNQNNKKENIQTSLNQIRKRGLIKERLKDIKENIIKGDIKEKKTVRSRKETLKIREREKYTNLQNEENVNENENELDKINNINNMNLNEKKENNRYKQYMLESRQESYKTKENTLSRYTKDSEISLDKNKYWANRLYGDHFNIKRYKESENNTNYIKNNNNENNEKYNIGNEYSTEYKRHFNTKKTRKDYINEKKIKNEENIAKEKVNKEVKTEKRFYKTNKKSIIISSYNESVKNRLRKNNNENYNNNDIDLNLDDEEDIPIFDKELRKDKDKYDELQRKLKIILYKSCLPKFNIDYYVIKNQIGIGSFGVIFQVYHIKTRCKYALKKIIAPDISTLQQFEKEFELVHQNPHPNILDLIGICIQCVDLTNFVFYVLMDLAEEDWDTAINNRSKIKKYYTEFELISILKQLTSALYYLQKEKKIAHRDIKPENILIFKNNLYKIGDFGEAKESKVPKQLSTLRGTELYMSPLLYNGLHENKDDVRHNPFKSDVFSLGYCFIYAASLNLNIIYKIRDVNSIITLKQILIKEFNGRYSERFIELILKMISFNEDKRVDFIDLEKILREEF